MLNNVLIKENNSPKAHRTDAKVSGFIKRMDNAAEELISAAKESSDWYSFVISEYVGKHGAEKNMTRGVKCLLTLLQKHPNVALRRLEQNARERFLKKPTYAIKWMDEKEKKSMGVYAYSSSVLPDKIISLIYDKTIDHQANFAVTIAVAETFYDKDNSVWIDSTLSKIAGERIILTEDISSSIEALVEAHLLIVAGHQIITEKNINIRKTYFKFVDNDHDYSAALKESQDKELFESIFRSEYKPKKEINVPVEIKVPVSYDSKSEILNELDNIRRRIESLELEDNTVVNEELDKYKKHYSKLDSNLLYLKTNIINGFVSKLNAIDESNPKLLKAMMQEKISDVITEAIEESRDLFLIQ